MGGAGQRGRVARTERRSERFRGQLGVRRATLFGADEKEKEEEERAMS